MNAPPPRPVMPGGGGHSQIFPPSFPHSKEQKSVISITKCWSCNKIAVRKLVGHAKRMTRSVQDMQLEQSISSWDMEAVRQTMESVSINDLIGVYLVFLFTDLSYC